MKKLSTVQMLIELLDVMQESKTVAEVESQEQIIEFLQSNIKSIAQKQKNKKAEVAKAKEMADTRTKQRKATSDQKQERIEKIKAHLESNPTLIASAKDLCETVFKDEGLKSQSLTRILIDLEKEGFVKVVGQKPKQVQKA